MQEILYIDLYFFTNVLFDALCIVCTARILPRPLHFSRLILSALLGGLYAVCGALFLSPALCALFFFPAVALTVLVAFRPASRSAFLRSFLFYLLSLSLCGGLFQALQALLGITLSDARAFPLGLFALLLTLFGSCTFLVAVRRRCLRPAARLCLFYRMRPIHCYGLVDTGNLLVHAQSGLPVVLIGSEAARRHFPSESFLPTAGAADPAASLVIRTPAGSRVLYGFVLREAYLLEGGKKRALPPFFLAHDPLTRDYSGCELLLSPDALKK